MIKVTTISLAVITALAFTACGGGGGSSSGDVGTETGQAFYIDSAVSGVNYRCGDIEEITGGDGSFIFEIGSSCTFYLGNIELRDIGSDSLRNGENFYETDITVARVLQSLDEDHNLNNGISINASIIQEMINNGLETLPTNNEELEKLIKAIADAGGTYISEEDAQSHLEANNPNLYSFKNLHYLYNNDPDYKYKVEYTYDDDGNKLTMKATNNNCWSNETIESKYTYDISNNKVTENYIDTEIDTYQDNFNKNTTTVETGEIVYTFDESKVLQKAELVHEGRDSGYSCDVNGCTFDKGEKYTLYGTFIYDYNTPNQVKSVAYSFFDSTDIEDVDNGVLFFNKQGKMTKDESHDYDGSYDLTSYEYSATGLITKITEYYTYPNTADYEGGKYTSVKIYNDDEHIISENSKSESLDGTSWHKYTSTYDGNSNGSCGQSTSSWEGSDGNSGTSKYTYYTNGKIKTSIVVYTDTNGSWTKTTRTYDESENLVDEVIENG